ncbi:ATP-binding protein [Agromyces sp. CFH 90414]|uniref:ATP-binding protein n=1 Tax=Agromyces agglutinans TaxID=2662258 RepID=A0A6I2F4K0_9MICO|nr:ATP-binding protein [Agromyces agglutinans]MRG58647.1 ATP-binding protein [Agromyces agglutinans]
MSGAAAALPGIRRAAGALGLTLIAIDGASGVGKSTFATALGRTWPGHLPELVRLDAVYPGWHGLTAGADLVGRRLVRRLANGRVGEVATWDWAADRPGGVERVRPGRLVIVEGCGAFAAVEGVPSLRIWLEASDAERRRAALERDAGAFDPFWEMWETQWRRYVARADPRRTAHVVLRRVGR